MSSDLDMLTVLAEPDRFKRYYHHVRGNFLTDEGETIAKHMDQYIDEGHSSFIWNHFAAWFLIKNPMLNFEKKDIYKKIFDALNTKEKVDGIFTQKILEELTTKSFADEIARKAGGISDGTDPGSLDDVEGILKDAQDAVLDLSPDDDPHLAPDDLSFLISTTKSGSLIQPSLEGLRQAFAGYGEGHFIVVGAHPDTGKTTFLLGEVSHALPQIPDDHVILYFNNEQAMRDMKKRLVTAVTGKTNAEIDMDPAGVWKLFEDAGGPRIKMYDKSYMNTRFVAERIKRHEGKISLIVFDQLWKIRGASKSQNDFMQLGHTFAWARDIAKEHAPVIAVHQADGDTMGDKYLSMEHLFGSRIAIQGEADAIITIGRQPPGHSHPELRHFHVPKNKLPDGSDPTERNTRFDAWIKHDIVKFKDVK